jgi:plasmid maintenance system antidote protein VapI
MPNKGEIEIMKVVGSRLRAARVLCDLPLHEAAELLGITQKELGAFELCKDVDQIPLTLIVKAGRVFDVSMEFLFGFSSDWEICEETKFERQVGHWIFEETTKSFAALAVENRKLRAKIDAMESAANTLPQAIVKISNAFDRFMALNPEFDDLLGGARLLNLVQAANELLSDLRHSKVIILESANG